jgi:hypothetical protein
LARFDVLPFFAKKEGRKKEGRKEGKNLKK